MRIRYCSRMLMGLGALVGLLSAGCQTPLMTGFHESGIYRAITRRHRDPEAPVAELMEPRRIGEDGVAIRPATRPAAVIAAPVVRVSHDEVGGDGVVASSWRGLKRAPETIDPSALNLTPAPRVATVRSPYQPRTAEKLPAPRKVQAPARVEPIVLTAQMSLPEKVAQQTAQTSLPAKTIQLTAQTSLPTKMVQQAAPAVHSGGFHHGKPVGLAPHEGALVPQAPYRIMPPDLLLIRMIRPRVVPDEAPQIIDGEHLVRPDGSVNVGVYGSVFVGGMTTDQARAAVAELIAERIDYKELKDEKYKDLPEEAKKRRRVELVLRELVLDVVAYRSQFYYVIADGGGPGEQVVPILITGNDTVLDAVGKVGGLPPQACKHKIWVARANCPPENPNSMLPVAWRDIAMRGQGGTNYQMFPGDRLYINSDPRLRAYTQLDRTFDLFDRTAGTLILGSAMVRSLQGRGAGTGAGGAALAAGTR